LKFGIGIPFVVIIDQGDIMNEIKNKLIIRAKETFKIIYPCGNKRDLSDCFTIIGNKLLFWFNTEDQTTHLITWPLDEKEF